MKRMNYILSGMLLLSGLVFAHIDTNQVYKEQGFKNDTGEGVSLPVPDKIFKEWKFAYGAQSEEEHGSVLEWIPKGEDIENWNQLIQIQHFELPKEVTAQTFAPQFIDTLKESLPNATSQVVSETDNSVLVEWKLSEETNGEQPQDELSRFITTKDGLFRVAYTKKVPSLTEEERAEWTKILTDAHLVQAK